ncbi:hypothetical protein D9615_008557 [Tricholomella constricta]|uniref:HNH nuclease domain-containing protein n=1 Tax=Tricholomella constricta TaxID=117010 RepID=A0A8H5H3W0_9AGAR|nr:hypothetical protein D9615_008557 [Tricholomella constricta]
MPTTDGSSTISDTRRSNVTIRDGGLCVLCGDDPVDVAHIVVRKAHFIRSIAPSLSGFRKDDQDNLLCLCPGHHRQYDAGYYVFVPSRSQRQVLLNHENRDFAYRESLIANRQTDPGRTIPDISDEIDFIPIHPSRFRAIIHHPTRYDQTMFLFDTADYRPCPLLHFRASPICLMLQAQPHLANVMRLASAKADEAQEEITTLIQLYHRQPRGGADNRIAIPASYPLIVRTMEEPNNYPSAHVLPTIPRSPPPSHPSASAPSMQDSFDLHPEVPGLTPSSSASTIGVSDDTEVDPDMYGGTDLQLLEYAKEPPMTWEDLKNRPPLFPGEEGGDWQFCSAEQIIRGEWH